MNNKLILKEITETTMKKLRSSDIVLPSDYQVYFKEVLNSKGMTCADLEVIIQEDQENNFCRGVDIIKETENLLSETGRIISQSNTAILNSDVKSLADAQSKIELLMNKVLEMSKEVYNDELTGVHNRKWFFKEYLNEGKYSKTNGVIAFIDMNKLKVINDSFGHKIGDKSLIFFAKYLEENLEYNAFIRYAGDEFIVVFENEDINISNLKLRKVNESLKNIKLKTTIKGVESFLKLSFSFGLSEFKINEDMALSIDKADHIMYKMKKKKNECEQL